jgi:hypothetical protein
MQIIQPLQPIILTARNKFVNFEEHYNLRRKALQSYLEEDVQSTRLYYFCGDMDRSSFGVNYRSSGCGDPERFFAGCKSKIPNLETIEYSSTLRLWITSLVANSLVLPISKNLYPFKNTRGKQRTRLKTILTPSY